MPGKKLPPGRLGLLKSEIARHIDESQSVTASKLHELINQDSRFEGAVSLGMVQNHLGNIRKGRNSGMTMRRSRNRNNDGVEQTNQNKGEAGVSRRTRLSIDKRVQAVHAAAKEAEKRRQAFEKSQETLQKVETELRDALRRSLGPRGETLFAAPSGEDVENLDNDSDLNKDVY